ncbi:alpha/beta fold hydrolase [Brevundimonas aveniformis]|uniref:alpha/beta fold hydrolase n=1 Tax=Brevundimonas aveniformis TaxID=370977 RepID=UPI000404BFBC|nr:alpha/beta fold hydrolase [Brevundimonas aveniformis]
MRFACPLAFMFALLAASPVLAQPPTVEAFDYRAADGRTIRAERGVIYVPENRDDAGTRQIPLAWVRLRSTAAAPGAPIIYLAGGPGGSGISTLEGPRQPVFLALLEVSDIVFFDQRGVGASGALPTCTAEAPFNFRQPLTEASYTDYAAGALSTCATVWREQGIDLSGYTTPEAADDVADLAAALGAPRVNLMGISYGTHLAFSILRRHPELIDRIVLASVEGPDQTVKRPDAIDAAFGRIDAAMPDVELVDLMRRVHAAYAEPQPMTVRSPDGEAATFYIDAFAIQMMAGFIAKNPSGLSDLAMLYGALDQGAADAVAPFVYGAFFGEPMTFSGMAEATDIASGVSTERRRLIAEQAPTALLGSAANFPMPQLADLLPELDLGEGFRETVLWDGPALILSGDLDVRTPMDEQATAISGLSGAQTILVHNGGHDLFEAHPDVPGILVEFFSGRPVTIERLDLPAPVLEQP